MGYFPNRTPRFEFEVRCVWWTSHSHPSPSYSHRTNARTRSEPNLQICGRLHSHASLRRIAASAPIPWPHLSSPLLTSPHPASALSCAKRRRCTRSFSPPPTTAPSATPLPSPSSPCRTLQRSSLRLPSTPLQGSTPSHATSSPTTVRDWRLTPGALPSRAGLLCSGPIFSLQLNPHWLARLPCFHRRSSCSRLVCSRRCTHALACSAQAPCVRTRRSRSRHHRGSGGSARRRQRHRTGQHRRARRARGIRRRHHDIARATRWEHATAHRDLPRAAQVTSLDLRLGLA
jgi:hypothetical protein